MVNQLKLGVSSGFVKHLIKYTNAQGQQVSALPFETEDMYYLVRMSIAEAKQIILDDDDYDEDGILRDDFADDVEGSNLPDFEDDDNNTDDGNYDDIPDESGEDEDED
ncbi:MAG: hypothetical protein R2836_07820 [Chitinophagales bacterium]